MHQKVDSQYPEIRRVTLIGGVVDGVLGVLKMVVGWLAQSQALIADGVHSLSDLFTDILVIWAAKHAHAGPDEAHPYGHEHIETLATLALSLALILVAAGFTYDAVIRLWTNARLPQPGVWALAVAAVSMLAKEAIYHYTRRAAERINSPSLRANAWHSRSDALSSLVVLLGVLGVMSGFASADIWATLGVAAMIGWVGVKLGYGGVTELIDTGVSAREVEVMQAVIAAVPGVKDVHQLRTRKMAEKIVMDAHVMVSPAISVSEGHRIGDAAERALYQNIDALNDVTLHIDYEKDNLTRPGYDLPLRDQVLRDAAAVFSASVDTAFQLEDFAEIKLHYLGGSVQLELWRELADVAAWDTDKIAVQAVREALRKIDYVSEVEVLYRLPV